MDDTTTDTDQSALEASQPLVDVPAGSEDSPDTDKQSLNNAQADGTDATEDDDDDSDDAELAARGTVPYERFREANEKRKATKAELAAEKAELAKAAQAVEVWNLLRAEPGLADRINPNESPVENYNRIASENAAAQARQRVVSTREQERQKWQDGWNVTFAAAEAEEDAADEADDPERKAAAKSATRGYRKLYQDQMGYFVRPQDTAIAAEVQQQTAAQQATAARAKLIAEFPLAGTDVVDAALETGDLARARKIIERAHGAVQAVKAAAEQETARTVRAQTPTPPAASNGRPPTPRAKSIDAMSDAEFLVWQERQLTATRQRKYGN